MRSKPTNSNYRDNYDAIFGKKKPEVTYELWQDHPGSNSFTFISETNESSRRSLAPDAILLTKITSSSFYRANQLKNSFLKEYTKEHK